MTKFISKPRRTIKIYNENQNIHHPFYIPSANHDNCAMRLHHELRPQSNPSLANKSLHFSHTPAPSTTSVHESSVTTTFANRNNPLLSLCTSYRVILLLTIYTHTRLQRLRKTRASSDVRRFFPRFPHRDRRACKYTRAA